MVDTAHNVGDAHIMIIHDDGQIVGGVAVRTQHDQVIKLIVGIGDVALNLVVMMVSPCCGDLKRTTGLTPSGASLAGAVAPASVIAWRAVFRIGQFAHGVQFFR